MKQILVDEALLRQVLKTLTDVWAGYELQHQITDSITALRTALEQPAVEPYAWVVTGTGLFSIGPARPFGDDVWQAVYTTSAPQPQQPAEVPLLRDEDIAAQMTNAWGTTSIAPRQAPTFARAIEQAVRQKAGLACS